MKEIPKNIQDEWDNWQQDELEQRERTALAGEGWHMKNGIEILTRAQIKAEQREWPDEDSCKTTDFNGHAFWIVADDGQDPIGFDTKEEVNLFVEKLRD